jgi:hypothetical protein
VPLMAIAVFALAFAVMVGNVTVASAGKSNHAKKTKKKKKKKRKTLAGPQGPAGPAGPEGPAGTPGGAGTPGADAVHQNSNWGVISRNTSGSVSAYLRDGPFGGFGVTAAPPKGNGSLGLDVATGGHIQFGNEVDYFGDIVKNINTLSYSVYQTDENTDVGGNNAAQGNLPNLSFEVNPHVNGSGSTYSSLVFIPPPSVEGSDNGWQPTIDASGATTPGVSGWWFTNGAISTALGGVCTQAMPCSWSTLKAALVADDAIDAPPMTVYSVEINKGVDNPWHGAVDAVRVDNEVADFNADGVRTVAP